MIDMVYILLMEEIPHQLIGSFCHYFLKVLAPSQVVFSPDFLNHQQDGIITYNIYNLIWLQLPPFDALIPSPGKRWMTGFDLDRWCGSKLCGYSQLHVTGACFGKGRGVSTRKKQLAEPELKDEHLKRPGVVFLRPLENEEVFTCEVNWE